LPRLSRSRPSSTAKHNRLVACLPSAPTNSLLEPRSQCRGSCLPDLPPAAPGISASSLDSMWALKPPACDQAALSPCHAFVLERRRFQMVCTRPQGQDQQRADPTTCSRHCLGSSGTMQRRRCGSTRPTSVTNVVDFRDSPATPQPPTWFSGAPSGHVEQPRLA
jgi:hypothetical protein